MKARWPLLASFALCLAGGPAMYPQAPADEATPSPASIREELSKLLLADSSRGPQPVRLDSEVPANPSAVTMSPYVVREPRIPRLSQSVYEMPLMRFLRDGTLYNNIGKHFTTRIRLRFYSTNSPADHSPGDDSTIGDASPSMFGNVRPRNGAQLGISWSW